MRRFIAGAAAAALMVTGTTGANVAFAQGTVEDTQTEIQNLAAEIEAAITSALAALPPSATEADKEAAVRLAILEAIEGHSASVAIAALALVIANGDFAGDPIVLGLLTSLQSNIVSYYIVGSAFGSVGNAPGGGTIITAGEFEYISPTS